MGERLEGRVAIVTGAAQGIGRGASMRLAAAGADVVGADVNPSVDQTWAELRRLYPKNRGFSTMVDVASAEEVDALVADVVRRLGRLDVILNNAGANQPMVTVAETPDELFDLVIGVNVRGVFNGCRAAARVMQEQRSGSIINIGSSYGKQGFARFGVYCASKAAVIRLSECMALELAPYGVRVNSVCPGNTATPMNTQALRYEAELCGITFEEMLGRVEASVPLGRRAEPEV